MNDLPVQQSNGLTRRLANFAASFSLNAAPAVAIENAKVAILDCLGVSVLAVTQEIGQAALSFARQHAARGSCTIWGTCLTTSPRAPAFCSGGPPPGLGYDARQ